MAGPILVTGGTGQLATALVEAAPGHRLTISRVGRPAFDFDQPAGMAEVFARVAPSLVVNAAAYTGVDAAEDNAEAAFRANRDGPAELARLCSATGVPLIHISTDYVFDGRKGAPYVETDATSPQGVYGASKLAGEDQVLAVCSQAIVLRTSWVYSPVGKNFVRTMLAAGQRNSRLKVVADQIGCPTSAQDLAEAVLGVAERVMRNGWQGRYTGIYHATGAGQATWHELAMATFAAAARHGQVAPEVAPIATREWPTRAVRPPDSRLDCGKLASVFEVRLPPWQDGLTRTVGAIFGRVGSPHRKTPG